MAQALTNPAAHPAARQTTSVPVKSLEEGSWRTGPVPRGVREALAFMQRAEGMVTIGQLVAVSGVSERALRNSFVRFVGDPPLAYLRKVRLAAVRQELLNSGGEASVTEVAGQHGFAHAGRFASDYRRCFQELPSATLRRSRQASARRVAQSSGIAPKVLENLSLPSLKREMPALLIEPFQTRPGDCEANLFTESLREQLAASLSMIHSLDVTILTKTSIEAKRQRGNGRCCLVGRVTREGGRVRVIVRLVDDANLCQLWGESYDGCTEHLLDLSDRVVDGVLHAIPSAILGSQINAAQRRHPAAINARDISLRVLATALSWERPVQMQALGHLERAMHLDPYCALAAALAGLCHANQAWNASASEAQARARELADLAALLDPVDPFILALRAHIAHLAGQFDNAEDLATRALAKHIGEPLAWLRLAWLRCAADKPNDAFHLFERAERINAPYLDGGDILLGKGTAYFSMGRYQDAEHWLRRASLVRPTGPLIHGKLAVCYALLGDKARGRATLEVVRRVLPDVTISQFLASYPCDIPWFKAAIGSGLDELGLPP